MADWRCTDSRVPTECGLPVRYMTQFLARTRKQRTHTHAHTSHVTVFLFRSHTGFRLVPTSMTLNDLERRNSLLLVAKTITHPAARSLCDSWASCFYSDELFILSSSCSQSSSQCSVTTTCTLSFNHKVVCEFTCILCTAILCVLRLAF